MRATDKLVQLIDRYAVDLWSISQTCLRAAFTPVAPKRVRIQSSCKYLFTLLGFTSVKAACKTLLKLTPCLRVDLFVEIKAQNFVFDPKRRPSDQTTHSQQCPNSKPNKKHCRYGRPWGLFFGGFFDLFLSDCRTVFHLRRRSRAPCSRLQCCRCKDRTEESAMKVFEQ